MHFTEGSLKVNVAMEKVLHVLFPAELHVQCITNYKLQITNLDLRCVLRLTASCAGAAA